MPIYLLDTNIIVFYLKNPDSPITSKFHIMSSKQFAVCSVVKAELFYGAAKSNNPVKSRQIQEAFLSHLVSFPFDDAAVDYYAKIRANLEKQGKPIGGNDTMIASIKYLVLRIVGKMSLMQKGKRRSSPTHPPREAW